MNTGDYDKEITVWVGTNVNTDGVVSVQYSDAQELFARVVELSGTERFKSQMAQDMSQRIAQFEFWFFRKISPIDRITYDGENWDIVNIRTMGREERTEITAQVMK